MGQAACQLLRAIKASFYLIRIMLGIGIRYT